MSSVPDVVIKGGDKGDGSILFPFPLFREKIEPNRPLYFLSLKMIFGEMHVKGLG